MIVLPKGAFMVLQDEAPKKEEQERPSIILSLEEEKAGPQRPNTGVITFTGEGVHEYQLWRVKFRENFAEPLDVEGQELLFFRNFDASIFYAYNEEDKE